MPAKKTASKAKAQTEARGSYLHKRSETQLLIEQAALYRLSVALNHETELQAMMDVAVRVAAELFKVELAAIALVDEGGDTFSGKANIGWSPQIFSFAQHIPLDSGNGLSYAISHQTVVAIPDELNETRWGVPAWVLQMGIASALIAPMNVGGKTVGGLIVNDRHRRDWNEDDQRLIALIANNTAESLERVNLFGRLRESQNFIRRVAGASPNLIYVYDMIEGRTLYTNRAIADILGYPHDQAGMDGLSALGHLMHPDDLKQYPRWIERYATLKDGEALETDYRLKHANGEWRWFLSRSMIFERNPDGTPRQIIGTAQEITERKRAEETRAELSRLLEESLNEIYVFDSETLHFIQANYGARHNLGYTLDELRALTPLDLKPEFNAQTFGELIQSLRTGEKQKIVFVTQHRRKDNSLYDVEVHLQRANFEGRQVFVAIILDITERKQAELILRESEERFSKIFQSNPVSIALSTFEDGRYVDVNTALLETLGYDSKDEVIGRTSAELNIWADPTEQSKVVEELRQHRPIRNMELRVRTRSGEVRDTLLTLERIEINHQPFTLGFAIDITERKQAEVILRESEERFAKIFHSSPVSIAISTFEDGRYVDVNDAFVELLGYDSKDEVIGRTVIELGIWADPAERNKFIEEFRQRGLIQDREFRIHTRRGEVRDALLSLERIEINHQPFALGFAIDITERKKAAEKLQASEDRFREFLDATPDALIIVNKDGKIILVNQQVEKLFGYTRDELLDETLEILIPKRFRASHLTHRAGFFANPHAREMGVGLELYALRKDGSEFPVEISLSHHKIEDDVVVLSSIRDITERKRAELVLRESEERFSKVFHSSPIAIAISTLAEGRMIDFNQAFMRMLDFNSKDELIGKTSTELNLWAESADRTVMVEQLQQKGYVQNLDVRFRTRSGEARVSLASIELIELDGKQYALSFLLDITERQRLELQQNRLATALESAGEIILITDIDANIQYVNPAFEHITGYTREEAIGRKPNILKSGKHGEDFYRLMWGALLQGDVWHGVITNKKKSGDLFDAEQTIAPIQDKSGGTLGYVTVMRDITERVQRERELEAIAQLSVALRSAPVLADMMPLLLDQLIDLLKADSVALIMRDAVNGDSVVEAVRGAPILTIGDRLAAGKGVAGYVIENGQPYLSQDLENDPRFARRIMIQGQWAAAFAPLATREQIIGALFIARQSTSIPNEDLRLLNTIGELAASAIHRASLHEQTRRRLEQLSTLHNIDRAISSSFDLRLTLNIVLDELRQQAGVGAASVLFLNQHLMTLEYAAERGFPRQLPKDSHLTINHSYAGRAVLERQAVVVDLTPSTRYPHLDILAKQGFSRYDGLPLIAKGKIKGVLEVFSQPSLGAEQNWAEFLETVASGLALAIDSMELFNELQRSNSELIITYDATLEGWSRALDLRDEETEGHTRRVTEMTLRLARAMNLNETEIMHIKRGALLHDIGKLGVPDNILRKPGPLTDDEWVIMRKHPQYAYDLLQPIPFLAMALDIPYCHHEKWDGSGYPRKLKSDGIPLAARVFAVADVWDALRSDRPYRKGWEEEKVRDHIRQQSGTHFDPQVVEVFLGLED